jgi:glycolate oxidase
MFVVEDPDLVPDIIRRLADLQVAEDLTAWMAPKPDSARGFQHVNINYGADSREELTWEQKAIRASLQKYRDEKIGGFMPLPPPMKKGLLEAPNSGEFLFFRFLR